MVASQRADTDILVVVDCESRALPLICGKHRYRIVVLWSLSNHIWSWRSCNTKLARFCACMLNVASKFFRCTLRSGYKTNQCSVLCERFLHLAFWLCDVACNGLQQDSVRACSVAILIHLVSLLQCQSSISPFLSNLVQGNPWAISPLGFLIVRCSV